MFTRGSMMARLALLVGICLVTSGNVAFCSFQSGPGAGNQPGPGVGGTFLSRLTLRNVSGVETASFVFGEQIRFEFEIENRSVRTMHILFPTSQQTDFLVVNGGTTQVRWLWSETQVFAPGSTELVFNPSETKFFTLVWDGTLADGTHLPPGNYEARGLLVYDGYETNPLKPSEFASPLMPFTVR
jgi:Intracellular proteinase inhibitor